MCYRRDLFQAAGLPTDRDAVSALWPTWDEFIDTGKKYRTADRQGHARLGDHHRQRGHLPGRRRAFYTDNRARQRSVVDNAARREAGLGHRGQDGRRQHHRQDGHLVDEWNAGFKQGTFATTVCPSWMTGIVEGNSGAENKGKWDVAAVPGGGGNWGGSWLGRAEAEQAPGGGRRAGRVPDQRGGPGRRVQVKGPLPSNRGAEGPGVPGLQEPVLQQRPDRQDLRRERQGPQAGLPRPEERGGEGAGVRAGPAGRTRTGRPTRPRPGSSSSRTSPTRAPSNRLQVATGTGGARRTAPPGRHRRPVPRPPTWPPRRHAEGPP